MKSYRFWMYSLFTKDYTEEFCSDRNIDNLRQLINVSISQSSSEKNRTDKVNVRVCLRMWKCVCMRVCVWKCECVCCESVCMSVCVYSVWMSLCVFPCVCVCINFTNSAYSKILTTGKPYLIVACSLRLHALRSWNISTVAVSHWRGWKLDNCSIHRAESPRSPNLALKT